MEKIITSLLYSINKKADTTIVRKNGYESKITGHSLTYANRLITGFTKLGEVVIIYIDEIQLVKRT